MLIFLKQAISTLINFQMHEMATINYKNKLEKNEYNII